MICGQRQSKLNQILLGKILYYFFLVRALIALTNFYLLFSITSFNEWGEGTQIEPAMKFSTESRKYEDYGDNPYHYLNITKEWTEAFLEKKYGLKIPPKEQDL